MIVFEEGQTSIQKECIHCHFSYFNVSMDTCKIAFREANIQSAATQVIAHLNCNSLCYIIPDI